MTKLPFLVFTLVVMVFSTTARADKRKARVLYLGDSLSMGAFGKTLDSGMRSEGHEVYTVVAGGASPYYWLKAYQSLPCTIGFWEKTPVNERKVSYVRSVPKMEDMIDEFSPDIVVVQTGINLYATLRSRRRPKDENVLEIRALIEQMCHSIAKSGAQSYWILPPHSHERRYKIELQKELASIMRSVITEYNGGIFESSRVTRFTDPYPATDGVHFGHDEATEWAKKVRADLSIFIQSNEVFQRSRLIPTRLTRIREKEAEQEVPSKRSPRMVQTAVTASSSTPSTTMDDTPERAPAPDAPPVPKETHPELAIARNSGVKLFDQLDLDLKLLAKSEIHNIAEIDYENALGVFEYEVIKDRMGNYPYPRIRVAHGIVFRKKFTSAAKRKIGSTISLRLVPLASYKNLRAWQTVDDLRENYEMPLYTPKLD